MIYSFYDRRPGGKTLGKPQEMSGVPLGPFKQHLSEVHGVPVKDIKTIKLGVV